MPVMSGGCVLFLIIFAMTLLGIIHFPVFLAIAMQSQTLSYVGLAIEFGPIILGAVIGALVGLIPMPAEESVASIERLKEQIGDVLENSTFKKLNYRLEPEIKENKKISQDDLIVPHQPNSSVSLRTSRSWPNFFKDNQSDTIASLVTTDSIVNVNVCEPACVFSYFAKRKL
jgi:hypothetical protein